MKAAGNCLVDVQLCIIRCVKCNYIMYVNIESIGMDYRPDWIDGTDEPAIAVLVSNSLSKMARRANQITEEVTKIKQRVDRVSFDK